MCERRHPGQGYGALARELRRYVSSQGGCGGGGGGIRVVCINASRWFVRSRTRTHPNARSS